MLKTDQIESKIGIVIPGILSYCHMTNRVILFYPVRQHKVMHSILGIDERTKRRNLRDLNTSEEP